MIYEPMIRSFSSLDDASAARAAVVAAGIDADAIELRVLEDEAGPVEGNFWVGNGRTLHGGAPAAVKTGPEVPYDDNFKEAPHRGSYLLIIGGVVGPAAQEAVRAALEPFDTVAPTDSVGTP